MVELPKGGNTAVPGPVIRSTLQTGLAPGDIDICALLVDEHRRARSDDDFVFFNNERSRCGSTRRLSPLEIEVDLSSVPNTIDAIIIAAAIDDGVAGSVADHGGGGITISGGSTVTHTFTGLTTERCVIAAEVYRRGGGWKVRAVSQGFSELSGLIGVFGVETDDESPSAPPASPTAPSETSEIVDRIRSGAAARRANAASAAQRPAWPARRNRRAAGSPAQQQAAYRAQRRAEAAQITADMAEQGLRLERVLNHLPHCDLEIPTLLGLIDASVVQPRQPRVRLFRRSEPSPPPPQPSAHLSSALRRLHGAAGSTANHDAVHAWFWLGMHATGLQPSFGHPENISVAPDGSRVVVDISLPDRATFVPAHSRAVYTPGDDTIRYQPAKPKEQARLAGILFSASLLAHVHVVAGAAATAGLPSDLLLVINGWEDTLNPATGLPERICRATLATNTRSLAGIDLRAVDPLACLRGFAGSLDEAGRVAPIAIRTGRVPPGRRIDLATIDSYEFEGLITELAEAMGYTAYRTPRSNDHGVDVYVESRDTLAGGKIVISVKRYNHTVGPDHVRALDSVIGDQGAIKGILVTTSGFGPESYRIARDKPLALIDGPKLREWLHEYLGVSAH
ncbi:restriction endonuclease [Pseudonocardia sp. GCM10023141]|uniref:restriction endonuclease n=1 Tax=Pseudonocardia sp. GCM10023141 TaxID=3252653 RepID=UPI00361BFD74